jgi:hypothetical protein
MIQQRIKINVSNKCEICNLRAEQHHEFKPLDVEKSVPEHCLCYKDPTWGDASVPDICYNYDSKDEFKHCRHCDHNEECHEPALEAKERLILKGLVKKYGIPKEAE